MSERDVQNQTQRGFFAPSDTRLLACRPLAQPYAVGGGRIGSWLRRNTEESIPHGIEWMHRGHYLENLERAAERVEGGFQGMHWMDSDLYKLMEAIAWDVGGTPDADRFLDETTDLLTRAQMDDGYLNSYYQVAEPEGRWSDFAFGHEMYLGGHLIQAGVAASRARNDGRLLNVGRRFADHLWCRFGPDGQERIDGHPEIETALVELFRETADERYLELARIMLDRRGHGLLGPGHFGRFYCQDEVPFRERTELTGHAVRAIYLAIGATDIAIETGDQALLEQCQRLWHNTVNRKSYLTGGVGSRHFHEALGADYELPPDRAYQETCASIAMAWWSHRLLMVTADDIYAEHFQRTTLNAVAAGVSRDGRHFWYRNPLMQRTVEPPPPENELLEERVDIGTRASWYNTACCPPNIMRFFASLPHLMAHEHEATVNISLPEVGELETVLSTGARAHLEIMRFAPAEGTLSIRQHAGEASVSRSLVRPSLKASPAVDDQLHTWEPGPLIARPHPRTEAIRGQVAAVFADTVYALEGRELEDMTDIVDVELDESSLSLSDNRVGEDTLPNIRAVVHLRGIQPERAFDIGSSPSWRGTPHDVELVPWASWAQDGPTTMRVWMPGRMPVTPSELR